MEQFPERYKISLKVNIFSNLPPKPASAWESSKGESSTTQPTQALIHGNELTQSREAKHNSKKVVSSYTAPILLNPIKNLSIHTLNPYNLSQPLVASPSPNTTSLNETQIFSSSAVRSDNPIKISPPNNPSSSNQPSPQTLTNITPTYNIFLHSNPGLTLTNLTQAQLPEIPKQQKSPTSLQAISSQTNLTDQSLPPAKKKKKNHSKIHQTSQNLSLSPSPH
jgi:hypothetical protein